MKKLLPLILAAALCTPVFAQKSGMTNQNAPTVQQTIVAGDAKISLDYTSITWASGQTMTRLMDKEGGQKARIRTNEMAPKSPLGKLTTSVDVKCGELVLAAGEYQIFFTIDESLAWSINFQGKDKTHTMKLELADAGGHEHKRLLLSLYAGDEAGAGVYVAFGKQAGMLSLVPQAAEPKK